MNGERGFTFLLAGGAAGAVMLMLTQWLGEWVGGFAALAVYFLVGANWHR